jgi:hypothetical protein
VHEHDRITFLDTPGLNGGDQTRHGLACVDRIEHDTLQSGDQIDCLAHGGGGLAIPRAENALLEHQVCRSPRGGHIQFRTCLLDQPRDFAALLGRGAADAIADHGGREPTQPQAERQSRVCAAAAACNHDLGARDLLCVALGQQFVRCARTWPMTPVAFDPPLGIT